MIIPFSERKDKHTKTMTPESGFNDINMTICKSNDIFILNRLECLIVNSTGYVFTRQSKNCAAAT